MVDAWTEWGLLAICPKGGSFVEYNGSIDRDSLEITQGTKDFDIIHLLNGGCLEKPTPEGEYVISFDIYFTDLDTTDDSGILQLFHTTKDNWDTTGPLSVTNSRNRDQFKVVVLFTEDTTVTSASSAITNKAACRFILTNARFVEATPVSFGDGILKVTCKFKAAPYTKAGAGNFTVESATSSESLDAVPDFS